jgi:PKD repeat protein
MKAIRDNAFIRVAAAGLLAGVLSTTCRESQAPRGPATPRADITTVPSVVLVGAGNIARCDGTGDEATAVLLDSIPGTVFALGDNAYPNGTTANYANCYASSWGRHRARTYPAPGNHDYDSSATAASYFNYYGTAAGEPGKGYYSYDLGAWHIIVLNSNSAYVPTAAGSVQETWLKTNLAATTQRCVLAMWHRPRFYSTTSSSFWPTDAVKPFWDDLYAARADLIINAHMHDYERFGPQTPSGTADPSNGIREIIVGTGGTGHDEPNTLIIPNSEVQISGVFGVLKLTLSDGSYAWQFIPVAGQSASDSGSAACHHAAPPPANQPPAANPGGPYAGTVGDTLRFDGSKSFDPDGNTPLTYAWNFGDGATGAGPTPVHVYTAAGTDTVTLVVTDTKGAASSPATTKATLTAGNQPPVAQPGGPYSAASGDTVHFDGSKSFDPDGNTPLTYAWTFGDGSTGTGVKPTHVYVTAGTDTVTLIVTDAKGASSPPTKTTATIGTNQPPVAVAGGPYSGIDTVRFDGSRSYDPDNDLPLSYAWTFGDGGTGTGATPTHAYGAAGTYAVTLKVTDAKGAMGQLSTTSAGVSGRADTAVVLIVAGNIASCATNRDELTANLLDAIPGTVLTLGDDVVPDAGSYVTCYDPSWGRHKARTRTTLGNHDYYNGHVSVVWDYWGDRAGPRGLGYYSFDVGPWHIIVLNSNNSYTPTGTGSAQDIWLQNDLAANTKKCTLAAFHQPLFFSSNTAGWTEEDQVKNFWNRLYAAGADLVLNGQQHQYERLRPMTPGGVVDTVRGLRSIDVGTGGESTELPVAIHPNSEVISAAFGVLKLTLYADRYRWEFVPMQGETFTDGGVGTCH